MNTTRSMVIKSFTMHITMMLFSAIVSFVGNSVLGILLGLSVYVLYVFMMYGDGADRGEKACSLTHTVNKLEGEGKTVEYSMKKQMYSRKAAVKAFVISSVPFFLLAVVNVIFAEPNSIYENLLGTITRIVFLPCAWITRIFTELVGWNIDGALELSKSVFSTINYSGMDFMALTAVNQNSAALVYAFDEFYVTILRLLFIPMSFVPSLSMLLGYFAGPKYRLKKMKEIEEGSRKKRKKLKVNKKTKTRVVRPEI